MIAKEEIIAVDPLGADIERIQQMMEEMANEPREPYGKRSPGEKCKYEVQRESSVGGTPYKDVRTGEERSTLEEETIQETNKGVDK